MGQGHRGGPVREIDLWFAYVTASHPFNKWLIERAKAPKGPMCA